MHEKGNTKPKNDEKIPQRAVLGQRGIVSSKSAFQYD